MWPPRPHNSPTYQISAQSDYLRLSHFRGAPTRQCFSEVSGPNYTKFGQDILTQKPDHIWQFLYIVYIWRRKVIHITRLFSTLSRVRLMSCILPQLNILCNRLVKPFYPKMTIHLLLTVQTLLPCYVFSNVLDFIRETDTFPRTRTYFVTNE